MSMSLTPTQLQTLIIAELSDPTLILTPQIGTLWALNAATGRSPFIQYLYTKRSGISLLLGNLRGKVTKAVGPLKVQYSDQLKTLADLLAATDAEIARQEKIARASGGAKAGVLTTTAPEPPPTVLGADRNSSQYIGSPYPPRRLR